MDLLASVGLPTNLNTMYPSINDSINKAPTLIICNDKLTQQNNNVYKYYMDERPVVMNGITGCEMPFNIRNQHSAELQPFYARNIDVESELIRINYVADKCYYNNYKINPSNVSIKSNTNGLACHAPIIVKDYSNFTKERVLPRLEAQKQQNNNNFKLNQFKPCLYPSSNQQSQQTSIIPQRYTYPDKSIATPIDNSPNSTYCTGWACQTVFNNFTRRSMISPLNNIIDINPESLYCSSVSS